MENPEEILHSLEEFSKMRPKDIPRELEEYLCFVAKTGDPVYQWSSVKSLFREKLINVITEFYETYPSIDIPPCPNVDLFNYESMKNFILEKLDAFAAAPFTVQRICELLTSPRKEYNRIDKYMRALEKNILVVSTTEPGNRHSTENGEGIMNGLESDHIPEASNSSDDINVEQMDDSPSWPRNVPTESPQVNLNANQTTPQMMVQETFISDSRVSDGAGSSSGDTVITCRNTEEPYVSIEPVPSNTCRQEQTGESEPDVSVTITAIPPDPQKKKDASESSLEPVVSTENAEQQSTESEISPTELSNNEAEKAEEKTEIRTITELPPQAAEEEKNVDSTSQTQQTKEDQETAAIHSETSKEIEEESIENVGSTSTEVASDYKPSETREDASSSECADASECVATSECKIAPESVAASESLTACESVAASECVSASEPVPDLGSETGTEASDETEVKVEDNVNKINNVANKDVLSSDGPKNDPEFEENSKDSEVSSSSSSVTSNEDNLSDDVAQISDDLGSVSKDEKATENETTKKSEADTVRQEPSGSEAMQVEDPKETKIAETKEVGENIENKESQMEVDQPVEEVGSVTESTSEP